MTSIRGFKLVFISVGVIYTLMAGSWMVRGSIVLCDFGIPESTALTPLVEDLFAFFYLLMAFVGVLTVLFGCVTRERNRQLPVAAVFFIWNIVAALRDLTTSDSRFGNHLYKGDKTLVFVYISLAFAAAFGYLVVQGLIDSRRHES